MIELTEIRRANGRHHIALAGGTKAVSETMGYANPAYLSQIFGPNPDRTPTEKLVRKLEAALGLPERTLDDPATEAVANADNWVPTRTSRLRQVRLLQEEAAKRVQVAPEKTAEMVQSVVDLIGKIIDAEKLDMSPLKTLDIVNMAVTDALEHGGTPREQNIESWVRLAAR